MEPLKPLPAPKPPKLWRGLGIPLAVNSGLLLAPHALSHWSYPGALSYTYAGLVVLLVFFQFFINGILMYGAFANDAPRWGTGFLLSGLLVLLVGANMFGQHMYGS